MSARECKGEYREEMPSENIKVSIWSLVIGLVAICGSLLGVLYARDISQQQIIDVNSNRITKLEVMIPLINENLLTIRDDLKTIRQQQRGK